MGRKKSYDRDTLIGKAMEIFRDHGFAGTSTQILTDELGVNRFSFYAEFGSKQELFEIVLRRYDTEVVERNFGPLEAPTAGLNEIRRLLEFFASASKGRGAGRGCLLCNTAVEFGPADPSGAGFVKRYFERISRAFCKALSNAQAEGEVCDSVVLRAEADFLTASTLGIFVMLRAKAPAAVIERAANTAIEHVKGLRA